MLARYMRTTPEVLLNLPRTLQVESASVALSTRADRLERSLSSLPPALHNSLPGTATNESLAATQVPGSIGGRQTQEVGLEQAVREALDSHSNASDTASAHPGQSTSCPSSIQDDLHIPEDLPEAGFISQVRSPSPHPNWRVV